MFRKEVPNKLKNIIVNEMNQCDIIERSNESCYFLSNSINEIEEQINTLSYQILECQDKLTKQELLLIEIQQRNESILKLFSPNYDCDKLYNDIDLKAEINDLYIISNRFVEEIKKLNVKKKSLVETKQCLEYYNIHVLENKKGEGMEFREKYSKEFGLNILEIQETERQRIARDLHDTIVQNLANIGHRAELCSKLLDVDLIRAKLELTSMRKSIKTDIEDMRFIIYNLRPMSIDDLGLINTVERYVIQLIDMNEVKVTLHANKENISVLPVISLTLFRVIQEACNNVLKHAHATQINIDINYQEKSITVTVHDNGVGFNCNNKNDKNSDEALSGLGLSIMKERINLMSGKIEIHSESNKGTSVIVSVPFSISKGEKNESD